MLSLSPHPSPAHLNATSQHFSRIPPETNIFLTFTMLVLVAGATGNVGQHLLTSLLSRGHEVRALGRNPEKLPADLRVRLEQFVRSDAYWDVPALERACAGVDAVICAYMGIPELIIEGQLLLLRAAERAGVRRFVAASWNYDWRNMSLGMHDSYDPMISFRNHVELSSTMRPLYIFTGILAEVLFAKPGHGDYSPKNHGVWDPEAKVMEIWGDPSFKWHWTCESDLAEFTAEIVQRDDAVNGGFWSVCSGLNSLEEIAQIYGEVKGCDVTVKKMGSIDELRRRAYEAREQGQRNNMWEYIGYFYTLYTADGTWTLGELDNERLGMKGTSLHDFLASQPDI
ncbi:hypothetical protein BDY21DRAFT_347105 [Lineolata rhizophorae]|uniref:NmrA-like domain-containing protein n=1 Tax=Lineolata rhizophorae TaxID=578093 RepID=A0A6A6NXA2_9PEZI|nr:hypothetical protein BDY21DRAFT_347105 [Lineolata rhizophorae]